MQRSPSKCGRGFEFLLFSATAIVRKWYVQEGRDKGQNKGLLMNCQDIHLALPEGS